MHKRASVHLLNRGERGVGVCGPENVTDCPLAQKSYLANALFRSVFLISTWSGRVRTALETFRPAYNSCFVPHKG